MYTELLDRIKEILQIGLDRPDVTFTIGNGNTESDVVDCKNSSLVAILLPSALTSTNIFIQGSTDNSTFQRVTDNGGVDLAVTFVADRWATIDPTMLLPYRYIKLEADSAEGAERTIPGVLRHLS